MEGCNAYESTCMSDVMGQTLRPGEFQLTKKAVEFCKLTKKHEILDLGCGMGATIAYLYNHYHIHATGIDPSEKLLHIAKENCAFAEFVTGTGDHLPFSGQSFDCIIAECTLSLMDDINKTLREAYRVLKNDGWFVITDVYAKNPEKRKELAKSPLCTCMRGLHDLELLEKNIKDMGFQIDLAEDCSNLLKELMVKIIFSYGSMSVFWSKTINQRDCKTGEVFWQELKSCKPGYFILIGRKKGDHG